MGLTLEQRIQSESPLLADTFEKALANPESQLAKDYQAMLMEASLLKRIETKEAIFLNMEALKQRVLEDEELLRLERYLREKAEKNLKKMAAHDAENLKRILAAYACHPRVNIVIHSELAEFTYHLASMHQAAQALQNIKQQRQQLTQQQQNIQQQFVNNVVNGLANVTTLTLNDGRTVTMQPLPADEIQELQTTRGPATMEQLFTYVPALGTQFNQLVDEASCAQSAAPHQSTEHQEIPLPPPPEKVIEIQKQVAAKMNLHHKPVVNKHIEARGLVERWLKHNLPDEDIKKIEWPDAHPYCSHIQNVNKFAEKLTKPDILKAEIKRLLDKNIECNDRTEEAQHNEFIKHKTAASAKWDVLAMLLKDPSVREKLDKISNSALSAYPDLDKKLAHIYRNRY